jgi:AhpC/TSA family
MDWLLLSVVMAGVATNSGGDTPQRLQSFAQRRHVTLRLAYDPDGNAHSAFGLKGYPGLVVIDRTGSVRLTREGYNSGEKTFRSEAKSECLIERNEASPTCLPLQVSIPLDFPTLLPTF